jgi:Sulfotransferase family
VTNGLLRESLGRLFGRAVEPFVGRAELWGKHNARLRTLLPAPKVIELLKERWPQAETPDGERPVFIFSAGWRSGSTLLQRLLVSKREVLIWGEPYTLSDHLGRLSESLNIFSDVFPPPEFFLEFHGDGSIADIQEKWIAHLYPEVDDLREAHRAFFTTLLAAPAARRGYRRWGFKDCKYGIEHAVYLKWLFPGAKFYFVYRNPYHAYRSLRLFGAYMRWPDRPVFTAREFGELWRQLMEGYQNHCAAVDGMMVKFEDLVARRLSVENIGAFAGVDCDPAVLGENISGRGKRDLVAIPSLEQSQLARAVEPLASRLGYTAQE